MEIHQLKSEHKRIKSRRIGRGGKRGSYSGHGVKGQKARAGAGVKPGFRGGDTPIWKLFPKKRGASRKLEIKKRGFRLHQLKPVVINLDTLERYFKDGDAVSPQTLQKKGLIKNIKHKVKILGRGALTKSLEFKDVTFSASVSKTISSKK